MNAEWMAEAKGEAPGVDAKDLAQGAKALNETKGSGASDALDYDRAVADAMAEMFTSMDGDIDQLFEKLGENPYKAKKYPPASAAEFGRKYAQGFYEYIGSESKA